MCIYIYIYIYLNMYVCMCVCACAHVYMRVCAYNNENFCNICEVLFVINFRLAPCSS